MLGAFVFWKIHTKNPHTEQIHTEWLYMSPEMLKNRTAFTEVGRGNNHAYFVPIWNFFYNFYSPE